MTKYCPSCGEELVDSAKFCKNCGTEIKNIQANGNSHHDNTQQFMQAGEKSHTAAIVVGYIMAFLIPLIGTIISIYLLTRDSANAKRHGKFVLVVALAVWIISVIWRLW